MRLTVSEIASATHAREPIEAQDSVTGITWDSRDVKLGDLYVALPGERVDGHDFAADAVAAGARAVLASRAVDVDVPVILVTDTFAAFVDLASYWRARIAGTVIGLTGSTGKTTTKNLVRDVLAYRFAVVATMANQNNELGVPRTLLSADEDTDMLVVEMGMRGAGEIRELCSHARPEWGLITNVGQSHIELLGSREAIAHAKGELLDALPDGRGIAFLNAADDYVGELVSHADLRARGVRIVFFDGSGARVDEMAPGVREEDDPIVWASDIELDDQGCPRFVMHARNFGNVGRDGADGDKACALALRGLHNVSNACSAAAVGLASGMTLAECCEALASAQPERGRQQVLESAIGVTIVDDAYNANPDSMRASLATFAAMGCSGRRIAVLGDMLELGDYAATCHEQVGAIAANSGLDLLVCVGDLSQRMAAAARAQGMPADAVMTSPDAEAALRELQGVVGTGDAVLVKASHSIGLHRVVEGLVG